MDSKTSIARVRYGELPPGDCGPSPGVIFRELQVWDDSGSRHALAAPGAAPGSRTKHIQTQEAINDAEITALHMSGSGAASRSRFPGAATPEALLGATTHRRLQVPPLGSLEPFLEAVSHDYIKRTHESIHGFEVIESRSTRTPLKSHTIDETYVGLALWTRPRSTKRTATPPRLPSHFLIK